MLKGIMSDSKLSARSREAYVANLVRTATRRGVSLIDLVTNVTETLKYLLDTYTEPCTLKSIISSILALINRVSTRVQNRLSRPKKLWLLELKKLDQLVSDRYKKNLPTPKQARGFVPWSEISAMREKLPLGSKQRLLVALYTLNPPLRCDYNRVEIIYRSKTELVGKELDSGREDNILVLSRGSEPSWLILREFKTSAGGAYKNALHSLLTREIRASLKQTPRKWLFETRTGSPYTPKAFSAWANRVLLKLFGRLLTLTLIRHSFISSLNLSSYSTSQREYVAQTMCHSVNTQEGYRFLRVPGIKSLQ